MVVAQSLATAASLSDHLSGGSPRASRMALCASRNSCGMRGSRADRAGRAASRISARIIRMIKLTISLLCLLILASAAELPTRKWLNLQAIKTLVAAAEAEAMKRNVNVTICIMDESGNLLFLQKADN